MDAEKIDDRTPLVAPIIVSQTGSVDEYLNDRAGGLGMGFPKFEMRAFFTALAGKVRRFHVEEEEPVLHNILRGFSKLFATVGTRVTRVRV